MNNKNLDHNHHNTLTKSSRTNSVKRNFAIGGGIDRNGHDYQNL